MSTEAMWIIGTVSTTVISVGGVGAAVTSILIRGVNTRIDDLNTRVTSTETSLRGFDARVRALEVSSARSDQRLEAIERILNQLVAPSASRAAAAMATRPAQRSESETPERVVDHES